MRLPAPASTIVVLLIAGCGPSPNGGSMPDNGDPIAKVRVGNEEMVLVPSSVSAERVKNLGLPESGSEDVSHLLVPPPNLPKVEFTEQRDYRPVDAVEWVIDIEFEGSPILDATAISNVFDAAWLKSNGQPTIYGWSPEINHWTYLISADAPKTFTNLAFGWPLFKSYDEDFRITSAELERYLIETQNSAKRLGSPKVKANRSSAVAGRLSELIRDAVDECNRDVVIVLRSPRGKSFDGKDVWDVMACLGLRWGDGDLFHWHNESGFGDDMFFSVETTTSPGYFLPEHIAAGRTRFNDLVFGYSIPRSAEPLAALDSMLKAVSYAKQRLGGELQDRNGLPLNEDDLKSEVKTTVEQLKAAGFKPGEDATLHVF